MDTNYNLANDLPPQEISYGGYVIRYYSEETSRHFIGYYVASIWFPYLERAKAYIDRMLQKTGESGVTSQSQSYGC